MRITGVDIFHQHQPFARGTYKMHHGTADGNDSYVVELHTASGHTGVGECAMLGGFYSEAFPSGTAAGLLELAPTVMGLDARQPRLLNRMLSLVLRGQEYVKTALDIAAWDLASSIADVPLCDMLGGRHSDSVAAYNVVIPGGTDAEAAALARTLVAEGYRRLQVKVGTTPEADAHRLHVVRDAVGPDVVLYADANGGFSVSSARQFLRLVDDVEFTFEQPCATLDECLLLRPHCTHPMVLDESIETLADLLRAHRGGAADGITIKLGRVGGITEAALIRDVAIELGVHVSVESIGGASINTAAYTHVAVGVPDHLAGHTVDFPSWVTVDNASGLPRMANGRQPLPTGAAGLGVQIDHSALTLLASIR